MEHEEYGQRKEMIYMQAVKQIRELDRKFAESGCMIEVGDIIGDHLGKIEVKKIVALHAESDGRNITVNPTLGGIIFTS